MIFILDDLRCKKLVLNVPPGDIVLFSLVGSMTWHYLFYPFGVFIPGRATQLRDTYNPILLRNYRSLRNARIGVSIRISLARLTFKSLLPSKSPGMRLGQGGIIIGLAPSTS